MDFGVFVFFAAMIYFISVLQNNKKRRKGKTGQEIPREPEETEPRETRAETRKREAPRASSGGYDAGEFRKRLRTAWKLPEKENVPDASMDLPDELEKPVYREPVRSAEEAPVCTDECREEPTAPKKPTVVRKRAAISQKEETQAQRGMTAAETERQRRFLEYAAKARQAETEPVRAVAFTETLPSEENAVGLSAKDARCWIMYDAVFGAPRAKRPWRRR